MDYNKLKHAAASAALVVGFLGASAASAATTTCSPTVAATLSPNMGCEVSSSASQQDFTQTDPTTVNAEAFFGSTDWIFESRDNFTEGSDEAQGGTLTLSSALWSTYNQVMAIFKSGDVNLIGFLLDPDETTDDTSFEFVYDSPFFQSPGGPKDISHISIYGQGTPDGNAEGPVGAVPLPAGLPMLASALGFALFLRKRRG